MKEAKQKINRGSKVDPIKKALKELDVLIKENNSRIASYVSSGGVEHHYLDGKEAAFNKVKDILKLLKEAL